MPAGNAPHDSRPFSFPGTAVHLGLAIDLSPTASAHTQTFLRAVRTRMLHAPHLRVSLVSDDRTPDGGLRAARTLIDRGVQAVVGHFSSRAAGTAVPLYRAAGLPVLLPAATSRALHRAAWSHVGLFSASDDDLLQALRAHVTSWAGPQGVTWHVESPRTVPPWATSAAPDSTLHVVLGSEAYARAALSVPASRPDTWLLVDDAGSPALTTCAPGRTVYAFGNRSAWRQPPAALETMFYWETWCALDVAAQLAAHRCDQVAGQQFLTSCGPVHFSPRGAASTAAHGRW